MQHPATIVDGRVDQGVGFTAIFGLHVKRNVSDFKVRVVAENHDPHLLPVGRQPLQLTYAPKDLAG